MVSTNSKNRKNGFSRDEQSAYRRLALIRVTQALLGVKVDDIEYPGGKSRESILMRLDDGRSVIATRREDFNRARVEISTLKALGKHHASVPRLLADNHSHVLIQEEVKGRRLSLALKDADESTYEQHASAALESLISIHSAATKEKLESLVSTLGGEHGWICSLIDRPRILGRQIGVMAPDVDVEALVRRLQVREPRFIKWDARPGNAMLGVNGKVVWFDWEHAGKRNRLDDLAWVLGDEFMPDYPGVENSLLERYVPLFSDVMSADDAYDYLMAYGTFHMTIRLGLILKHMRGKWWDLDYCIDGDKIGITLLCAQRLCARGARWSARCSLTSPLSRWFEDVGRYVETL